MSNTYIMHTCHDLRMQLGVHYGMANDWLSVSPLPTMTVSKL